MTLCHAQIFYTMINLQSVNVELPKVDSSLLFKWIDEVARVHDKKLGNITYLFCDDAYIIEANNKFLGHDYFTDIITFDYSEGEKISGDIILSVDTVASNAQLLGITYNRELLRVIIHGVLHLCGINDKGEGEREIMESHENDALSLYDSLFKANNQEEEVSEMSVNASQSAHDALVDWDDEEDDPDFDEFLKETGLHL